MTAHVSSRVHRAAAGRLDLEQLERALGAAPEQAAVLERELAGRRTGLDAGMQYSLAIRNRRVRAATVLPTLIGKRTLALLRNAGATVLHRNIKIPRAEVRAMIAQLAITLASRQSIERIFRQSGL